MWILAVKIMIRKLQCIEPQGMGIEEETRGERKETGKKNRKDSYI